MGSSGSVCAGPRDFQVGSPFPVKMNIRSHQELSVQRIATAGSRAMAQAELLEQMGWKDPPLAGDFHHPGLVPH